MAHKAAIDQSTRRLLIRRIMGYGAWFDRSSSSCMTTRRPLLYRRVAALGYDAHPPSLLMVIDSLSKVALQLGAGDAAMPLDNLVTKNSVVEAVAYAIADRADDTTNYNLEKRDAQPYDEGEVCTALRQAGYRAYATFAYRLAVRTYDDGTSRVWKLVQNKASVNSEAIAADFMARPKKAVHEVDPRFRAFHQQVAMPVGTYLKNGLLRLEVEYASMLKASLYRTTTVTLDAIENALRAYVQGYYAPLGQETTGAGEYRIDDSHGNIDPLNPHSFRHIHVYHSLRNYHTTLRLEA